MADINKISCCSLCNCFSSAPPPTPRPARSPRPQEPTSSGSDSGDCAFMDKSRFLYLDDGECGSTKAAICQKPESLSHYPRVNLDAVTDTPSPRNPALADSDAKHS